MEVLGSDETQVVHNASYCTGDKFLPLWLHVILSTADDSNHSSLVNQLLHTKYYSLDNLTTYMVIFLEDGFFKVIDSVLESLKGEQQRRLLVETKLNFP